MGQEFEVYIVNLGKYNEGKLVGAWFTLPVSYDDIAEKIGLDEHYEEYAIHDYELPFDVSEYESIETLNRYADMYNELDDDVKEIVPDLMSHFTSFEELCEKADDLDFFPGCNDMYDVAYELVSEGAIFGELPDYVLRYIDYEALGTDLDIEGTYIRTKSGIVEVNK